jgi:AraC-like DNA-binding protein
MAGIDAAATAPAPRALAAGETAARGALRERLLTRIRRWAPRPGRHATPWPGLLCFHADRPTPLESAVYRPAFCVVAQGSKEASIANTVYRYDPLHYLIIGAPMPVRARIVDASPAAPYLSLTLGIQAAQVRPLLLELTAAPRGARCETPPLRISTLDDRFLDAVVRFLEHLDDEVERRVLAPGVLREILYLTLRREQADLLALALGAGSRSPGVARALHYIHAHLDERFDVSTLARAAGMSASSLHHRFKAATALTPVQYLKSMRLDRARQLMLDEGFQAAEAAVRVGYESPSQFSREFKRAYGLSPRAYREREEALAR